MGAFSFMNTGRVCYSNRRKMNDITDSIAVEIACHQITLSIFMEVVILGWRYPQSSA